MSIGTRLLTGSSALLWGLQFAFLNPVIALLLVALYGAGPGDVGWVLAVFNASGFVAALVIPAIADRRGEYLLPLLLTAFLTLALAGALAIVTTLPAAVVALVVLGGPASVGVTMLFAELRHSGSGPRAVITARAVVSFSWVAGPPAATLIIEAFGERAILLVLAVVAALNVATTAAQLHGRRRRPSDRPAAEDAAVPGVRKRAVAVLVVGFVLLQATNAASVTVMTLFVSERLGLSVVWAGIVLGVAALLEIPALLVIGRLAERFGARPLVATGVAAGILYYTGMTVAGEPWALLLLQPLNAWFFGVVAGIGLTVFQDAIPSPGLASGVYTNTRRIGAVLSGPIIAFGGVTPLGYQGVFLLCAIIAVAAVPTLAAVRSARQAPRRRPVSGGART